MLRIKLKTILSRFTIFLTLCFTLGVGLCAYAFFDLESEMNQKLEAKKFLIPTEFYALPPYFKPHMVFSLENIKAIFEKNAYRSRASDQRILNGDYFIGNPTECADKLHKSLANNQKGCALFVNHDVPLDQVEKNLQSLIIAIDDTIAETNLNSVPNEQVQLTAPLLAQYVGNEPILHEDIQLGQVPSQCLNAIISIEDNSFLDHGGISYKGIFRALVKNITSRRSAQGGSTITQQLVKNYFLTSEKTIKRKAQEIFMSILLESKFSKDEILETYLNVIYMGQNGAFQVRGYGAAAQYYFNKNISQLQLHECTLLAAIINSPGLFNPFKKSENATRRRKLVLDKMLELKFITEAEAIAAQKEPLPIAPARLATETAPYYIDAARKQMQQLGLNPEGKRIYTALDLQAQEDAQNALQNHIDELEAHNKTIKKIHDGGQLLEGVVLSGDPKTGLIQVAVGGRSFKKSQFNRAIEGHRQIGSTMKPIVFLTALNTKDKKGDYFTPVSILNDTKFTEKYENQVWSPENYGKKYFGNVPMYYALKNSLNAATASLGIEVGLSNIISTARALGVESDLKPFPSLTLGAFELYPREVLQAYMTLSQMGKKAKTSFIQKVTDLNNNTLFTHNPDLQIAYDPTAVAQVVGMMKQTILSGSARAISMSGFNYPAAGKTGTTNDYKDAWFSGFTPYITTIVWVGYDNNTTHNLSGSSGAVPVWLHFMQKSAARYPADDFAWPESTEKRLLDESKLKELNALQENYDPKNVELIFRK